MNALAMIERRLDRHAVHQLRAEVVRLAGMVDALTAALDDAEQRERWADDSARFWQDVAELERDGCGVGLTQSGEVVAMPRPVMPTAFTGTEIVRAVACDNAPRMGVIHGEELADCEADRSEAGGEARTMDSIDARRDQADAGHVVGTCSDCKKPVTEGTGQIHHVAGFEPFAIHRDCIPF